MGRVVLMTTYGTNFVESEAILAAQEDDMAEVFRIVAGMLPGERRALLVATERLASVLREGPL